MKTKQFLSFTALLILISTTSAFAGWTVAYLHPDGYSHSQALGISNGQPAGSTSVGIRPHASVWPDAEGNHVDLNPTDGYESVAYASSDGQQAGYARLWTGDWYDYHAALWNGTADSFVDLNPDGIEDSWACAIDGGQQAGYVVAGDGRHHASLWSGTAESFIDLNPDGVYYSYINDMHSGRQVGYASINSDWHAALWSGSASSFVDLNPAGSLGSYAYGISGDVQVGCASFLPTGAAHAGLWTGTAGSFVDLHPAGAIESVALGVSGGRQVGWVSFMPYGEQASIWDGTADSYFNLHSLLGPGYSSSRANGIEVVNGEIRVVGNARNSIGGDTEAVMWHYETVPEPSSLIALCGGLLALARLTCRTRRTAPTTTNL